MLLADLHLSPAQGAQRAALWEAAQDLLIALRRNGQVYGEPVVGWVGGRLRATVYAAAHGALATRHLSAEGRKAWQALGALCREAPRVRVLERGRRRTEWRTAGALYLFTHLLDRSSPVCAGDDGVAIPAYVLPIGEEQRTGLHAWAESYRQFDDIAIDCGALEIPAYRQLAEPKSELSQTGRALCQAIERATRLPTYYYLHRYWGRPEGEAERPCPGCGRRWAQKAGAGRGLAWFDFRCVRCRLVSHQGPSLESARLARIGDWQPGSPRQRGKQPR